MLSSVVGHTAQRNALKHLCLKDKLPSSLLFSGISGIGKLLVAKELGRTLFCQENRGSQLRFYGGCGKCKECHLFDVGNLPDFYQVECSDSEQWSTARIRELLYSLHLSSFGGSARVVIFNDVENISLPAANALLKILEEPRSGLYFILVTSNPSKLPATIVSRCQSWGFNHLLPDEIREVLKSQFNSKGTNLEIDIDELTRLADGTLDNLEAIAQHGDAWQTMQEKLSAIFNGDVSLAIQFGSELSKDKENLPMQLRLMRIFSRERMRMAGDNNIKTKWAVALNNCITAERLIFERNMSAGYLLPLIFTNLVSDRVLNSFTTLTHTEGLIDSVSGFNGWRR